MLMPMDDDDCEEGAGGDIIAKINIKNNIHAQNNVPEDIIIGFDAYIECIVPPATFIMTPEDWEAVLFVPLFAPQAAEEAAVDSPRPISSWLDGFEAAEGPVVAWPRCIDAAYIDACAPTAADAPPFA